MSRVHVFNPERSPIGAVVRSCVGRKYGSDRRSQEALGFVGFSDINERGMIDSPVEIRRPDRLLGFYLNVLAPKSTILCQRDHNTGEYIGLVLDQERATPELDWWETAGLIEVRRKNDWSYTVWHDQNIFRSNNVGLWEVKGNHVTFREVGIIAPEGRNFMVLDDVRWDGHMYQIPDRDEIGGSRVVGMPSHIKYGAFDVRRHVLAHAPFREAVGNTLPPWEGTKEELEARIDPPTDPNTAIVDWWHVFTGMGRGQGMVLLHDGKKVWLRGADVADQSPTGVLRLERSTQVSYEALVYDMGRTPRLAGARLLSREVPA